MDPKLDLDLANAHSAEEEPKVQTGKPSAYYRASAFCLHNLAYFAGSSWTFGLVLLLIGGWAVAGIFLHGNEIWQIVMQDASSIQCYLWDITLLFIQRYDFERLSQHLSVLQASAEQRAEQLPKLLAIHKHKELEDGADVQLPQEPLQTQVSLPAKSWYDAAADVASVVASSPYAQMIYWGGIIAWLSLGPSMQFDNKWQLDVNTATAVELTIMCTFLQNTKRRHRSYMHMCSHRIVALDVDLHERMGLATSNPRPLPACAFKTEPQRQPGYRSAALHGIRVGVERYSAFIGSIGGIVLSVLLLGVWLGLGKVMGYNNANWWLIIGTYTGLAGFFDAFILRNLLAWQSSLMLGQCDDLDRADEELFTLLGIPHLPAPAMDRGSLVFRVSMFVSWLSSTLYALLASVLLIVTLLSVATAMHWSQTGQLLCNTPTMIIEGGMLLTLMMAHMAGHVYMRGRLQVLLQRRAVLQGMFDRWGLPQPASLAIEIKTAAVEAQE